MLKKKCPSCNKKVERKYNYCPWCAHSFKKEELEQDFGMIGVNDEMKKVENQMALPFGFNGIFNTLMKQIEKDLANLDRSNGSMPKGFKIQISTGMPKINKVENMSDKNTFTYSEDVEESEKKRRLNLERVEAESNIRRLPEGVIYEISAPGIKDKSDVVITKLEESIEIKAYSKDKCYVKTIPLKVEILGFSVKNDKVFLKIRS